jgi:hypothetical protein
MANSDLGHPGLVGDARRTPDGIRSPAQPGPEGAVRGVSRKGSRRGSRGQA